MKRRRPWWTCRWSDVRLLVRYDSGDGGKARLKRKKGIYSVKVVVSEGGDEKRVSLELRRTSDAGKDRMLIVGKPAVVSDSRLQLENNQLLDFVDCRDAAACASALEAALREPARPRSCLDVNDLEVQRYVAGLLVDPHFEALVTDLGAFYARVRGAIPSRRPAGVVARGAADGMVHEDKAL